VFGVGSVALRVGGIFAFRLRPKPSKVLAIVVLGFRIALRNGSQSGRSLRRRAAGGGNCRYA
jgi:hypothetical protein